VGIGSRVFVYGYPEPATTNVYLSPQSGNDLTLTAGIVSAIRTSKGGWPVIQMDAFITHGSSGSPVCNENGEVIGLATFGSLEQKTGALATGYNFAIPNHVVREFLDEAKVTPEMSLASTLYNTGLSYFYDGFYKKAKRKFEQVKKLNANYPQLNHYLTQSENKIEAGEDKESNAQANFFRVMGLIAVVGIVYIIFRWRKRKRNYSIR
jgi:hypothetical protein